MPPESPSIILLHPEFSTYVLIKSLITIDVSSGFMDKSISKYITLYPSYITLILFNLTGSYVNAAGGKKLFSMN